jgi:hypothetical protein
MSRQCDGCTKCCDGTLSADIYGHKMFPGTKCFFADINVGCTIYKDRPEEPCQTYICEWKKDSSIPESLKPSNIDTIIDYRQYDNFRFLHLSHHDSNISFEEKELSVETLKKYCIENNINCSWFLNGSYGWQGGNSFNKFIKDRLDAGNGL